VSPGDWEPLAEIAIRHDVAPWLFGRAARTGIDIPAASAHRLRAAHRESAVRNTVYLHHLAKALRALQAEGVPVIPLKGAYLAEQVYGDAALRPMSDIDLLVKQDSLAQAVRILRGLGFDAQSAFDVENEKTYSQDMPEMRNAAGVPVELHWTLAPPPAHVRLDDAELEGLWKRAEPAAVAGVQTLALSPTDLLLHLCVHVSVHHRFNNVTLRNFIDFAEVRRRFPHHVNWDELTTRAGDWGVSGGVRISLELAAEWTGLDVPAEALRRLGRRPDDEAMKAWAREKIARGSPPWIGTRMPGLEGSAGIMAKLRVVRDALFLPRAVMSRIYPAPADSWRIAVYYPLRWVSLCRRFYRALWRLMIRNSPLVEDARREAQLRRYLGWERP